MQNMDEVKYNHYLNLGKLSYDKRDYSRAYSYFDKAAAINASNDVVKWRQAANVARSRSSDKKFNAIYPTNRIKTQPVKPIIRENYNHVRFTEPRYKKRFSNKEDDHSIMLESKMIHEQYSYNKKVRLSSNLNMQSIQKKESVNDSKYEHNISKSIPNSSRNSGYATPIRKKSNFASEFSESSKLKQFIKSGKQQVKNMFTSPITQKNRARYSTIYRSESMQPKEKVRIDPKKVCMFGLFSIILISLIINAAMFQDYNTYSDFDNQFWKMLGLHDPKYSMYITYRYRNMLTTRRLGIKFYIDNAFQEQIKLGKFFVLKLIDAVNSLDSKHYIIELAVEGRYIREINRKCKLELNWMLSLSERA